MSLSVREYEVAGLIAWGASGKEVAEELFISPETAQTHRRNILRKIKGHNGSDITRWFFERKCNMCFGLNPRQIRHIAFGLLLLVMSDIFVDTELLTACKTTCISMSEITIEDIRQVVKEEFDKHDYVRNTVVATLSVMGLKTQSLQAGRIYRTEIVETIGRRAYDKAVREGLLTPHKNSPLKRNSKVYIKRREWEEYKKMMINQKL